MSKAKATFQSALWNHAGKILEYLFMYATSVLVARTLGVHDNGTFVGLISVSQLLLVLVSFGMETSLNKHIPQFHDDQLLEKTRYAVRRVLVIRALSFLAAALVFGFVLRLTPLLDGIDQYVWLLLFYTGVRSLVPLLAIVLTAQLRTALTAKIGLATKAIELVAVAIMAGAGVGVAGLFGLFIATNLLYVVLYVTFGSNNLIGNEEPVSLKPLVAFGGVYWLNTFVEYLLGRQGDVLLLTNLLPDPSQGSLYDVAYSVAQLASLAMTVGLSGVTLATFARLAVSSRETMDRFYAFTIRVLSLLTIPCYSFILFNAASVVNLLYSDEYLAAASLVQGMMIFRICSRLWGGAENAEYLLSRGRVAAVVGIGAVSATLNVALNFLLIPRLGAMGSVLAGGSANLLVNLLGALLVYGMSNNRAQTLFWAKLAAGCIVASLGVSLLAENGNLMTLFIQLVLYGVLVVFLLLLIRPLTGSDVKWFSQIDGRLERALHRFATSETDIASVKV